MRKCITKSLLVALLFIAIIGCEEAAPKRPSAPPNEPTVQDPEPAEPKSAFSCKRNYIFEMEAGLQGALQNSRFYWGREDIGSAQCNQVSNPNQSIIGRVSSVAGGDATGEVSILRVLDSDNNMVRIWFVLHLKSGEFCAASTSIDGSASCFASVTRDSIGIDVDDLPETPYPIPDSSPQLDQPIESGETPDGAIPTGGGPSEGAGSGPGGGDVGDGCATAECELPTWLEGKRFGALRTDTIYYVDDSTGHYPEWLDGSTIRWGRIWRFEDGDAFSDRLMWDYQVPDTRYRTWPDRDRDDPQSQGFLAEGKTWKVKERISDSTRWGLVLEHTNGKEETYTWTKTGNDTIQYEKASANAPNPYPEGQRHYTTTDNEGPMELRECGVATDADRVIEIPATYIGEWNAHRYYNGGWTETPNIEEATKRLTRLVTKRNFVQIVEDIDEEGNWNETSRYDVVDIAKKNGWRLHFSRYRGTSWVAHVIRFLDCYTPIPGGVYEPVLWIHDQDPNQLSTYCRDGYARVTGKCELVK